MITLASEASRNIARRIIATTATNKRGLATRKRFYRKAEVRKSNGKYEIWLDQRKLKTPASQLFLVPTEPLALAVANEWNAQQKVLRDHSMHLTSLCNTALDNPLHSTPDSVVDRIMEYMETDTLCYRQQEPVELAHLQKVEWDPILKWFEERFGVSLNVITTIDGSTSKSKDLDQILRRQLLSYNFWALTGIQYAVEAVKSIVLVMAVVERRLTTERAAALSHLEADFQISRWGNVEWAHQLDFMDSQARLSAATLFVHLNCESALTQQKLKI